jgi:hypothetical protein
LSTKQQSSKEENDCFSGSDERSKPEHLEKALHEEVA